MTEQELDSLTRDYFRSMKDHHTAFLSGDRDALEVANVRTGQTSNAMRSAWHIYLLPAVLPRDQEEDWMNKFILWMAK